jgi:hypothetical protein
MRLHLQLVLTGVLLNLCACSKVPTAESVPQPVAAREPATPASSRGSADASLSPLFSHIWRVTKAPSQLGAGSIYIFLPNGTLLQTSCLETYRIAAWTIDKNSPRILSVVEDRQPAYTASIEELTGTTLRLQQRQERSKETRDIVLTAVEQEFVCPDMPK